MDEKLESKLLEVETRFNELMTQMGDPAIANDYARFAELNKQRNELEPVIDKFREFKQAQNELMGNEELAAGDDPDWPRWRRLNWSHCAQNRQADQRFARLTRPQKTRAMIAT
ncbi:MAG: PCRF domain-containing protein [Anaerolineae bacterium]|nr:PCRF domain-containing protein [Anaerolineae bacterium]